MITPQDMRKVKVVGHKSVLKKAIETLYELNIYHIQDHSKEEDFDIGTPLENASELSEQLVLVRSLISHLQVQKHDACAEVELGQVDSRTRKLAENVHALVEQKRAAEAQLGQLVSRQAKLAVLKVSIPIEAFFSLKAMKGFCGPLQHHCRGDLENIAREVVYETYEVEGKQWCVVFVEAGAAVKAEQVLTKNGFAAYDIKELEGLKGAPAALETEFGRKSANARQLLAKITSSMNGLADQHGEFLLGAEAALSEELKKAEAPLRFGSSQELFLVTGWVPESDAKKLEDALVHNTKERVYIEIAKPIQNYDSVPTKLKNPKPISSFESLLKLFSWPKYGEIDPSFLMFFTLPLFFGMMLGDIGYGLISLLMFSILRVRMPQFRLFLNVLIMSSIAAMAFGFLFGEVFGLEEINGYHLWHVISRAHDITTLMMISFIIGLVHVNLGLVLGFINEYRMHGIGHALTHKVSWMLVQVAGAFWFLHATDATVLGMAAFWPATISSVIAISLLLKGEGFMGLIELPSIISNIVSYARIMAVGLASVFLAMLINDTASTLFGMGMAWFIILGVPLIIIGHGFNLALGIFSPFLHSVRLHYVEFFTKFYQGGGKEFIPFGVNADK